MEIEDRGDTSLMFAADAAAMPTVLRTEGYRLFFYAEEGEEPPHVHLEHGDKTAKFWLSPVRLARQRRFSQHHLSRAYDVVVANERQIQEAWDEFCARKV